MGAFDPCMNATFSKLLRDFSATGPEYKTAEERASRLAKLLLNDGDSGAFSWRLGGSAGKHTALGRLSDIDLVVYLDGASWEASPGQWRAPERLLGWLHQRIAYARTWQLQNGYARVTLGRRSVRVTYTREGSVTIDVVPILTSRRNPTFGWIPDPGGEGYRKTSIERQLALLDLLDTPAHDVRGGVRLLKLWAKGREAVPLKSYALEVLGLYAAYSGAPKTPSGILWWTLDQLANGVLHTGVHLPVYFVEPDCDDEIRLFDPADAASNLTADLTGEAADEVAEVARSTLRALRCAERALKRHPNADVSEHINTAFEFEDS